jgi:hypothetical protein
MIHHIVNTNELVSQLVDGQRIPTEYEKEFCVYALHHKGEVVYVGSSERVESRIIQHHASGKIFESYSFVIVNSEEEMHELEVRSITSLHPKYNIGLAGTTKSGFASIGSMKLRYGFSAKEIKKYAKEFDFEILNFRGCNYYNTKDSDKFLEALA